MTTAALLSILDSVLIQGHPLDKAFARVDFGKDKSQAVQAAQHLVRYARRYGALAGRPWPLRKGDLPAVLAAWSALEKPALTLKVKPLVLDKAEVAAVKADPTLWESYPDWLYALMAQRLPNWGELAKALNKPAAQYLRVNSLKTDARSLQRQLAAEKVEADIIDTGCLKLRRFANVFRTQAFKDGSFEQQDWGSQQVAAWLDASPGMTVIDACAGAGGKTLALAAQMQNKGRLLAMDIFDGKLLALRKRARRAGVHNLETRLIEGSATIKRLKGKADRLLLDVPCSGLGVLRRNPDCKWTIAQAHIDNLIAIQKQILDSYSRMLKPGGQLVYATCSLLPQENELQVAEFIERSQGQFVMERQQTLSPLDGDTDGFYMALIKRQQ
ncbi:methyltransferase domain-containing protein [Gallaecimonas kandeliae]|uniref:RsmB/NOP family class I SAM-dependent RNA methyltransferase n=1 Tax=Gallaecimonas kandeliae TaxID=3029055 RepID=UPI002648FCD3|nr:methyltransferase domain-containing protein [Gallaecimonas kandeliae]WKE65407.1 methyltransferase domain-containing protein [Gallaecimonas kandeliae]